mgnify:CR=1 FL=1
MINIAPQDMSGGAPQFAFRDHIHAGAQQEFGRDCINSYLIIGFIAVFHTKVIILDIYFEIWENQFVFDKLPDNPGHFIAIQLHHRNIKPADDFFYIGQCQY